MVEAPRTLKDLYTVDMRDLWSANDQMEKIMQAFSEKATEPKLKRLFERSSSHIAQHTQALREMMDAESASPHFSHCLTITEYRPSCCYDMH